MVFISIYRALKYYSINITSIYDNLIYGIIKVYFIALNMIMQHEDWLNKLKLINNRFKILVATFQEYQRQLHP